jgi:hypothetical protein
MCSQEIASQITVNWILFTYSNFRYANQHCFPTLRSEISAPFAPSRLIDLSRKQEKKFTFTYHFIYIKSVTRVWYKGKWRPQRCWSHGLVTALGYNQPWVLQRPLPFYPTSTTTPRQVLVIFKWNRGTLPLKPSFRGEFFGVLMNDSASINFKNSHLHMYKCHFGGKKIWNWN